MTEKLVAVGNVTNTGNPVGQITGSSFMREQLSALCRCLCISTMIIICHLDKLTPFFLLSFRDAGPKCPVDNERLNESQVIIDNVSKHF